MHGPVGCESEHTVEVGRERILQTRQALDLRLTVVGAHDDRVAFEEGLGAAGGAQETSEGRVGALESLQGAFGPALVRGVVVVREVEDEEVEGVAGHQPAADDGGVVVDRPAQPGADSGGDPGGRTRRL